VKFSLPRFQPHDTPFAAISAPLFHAAESGNSGAHLLLGQYFEDMGEVRSSFNLFTKKKSDFKKKKKKKKKSRSGHSNLLSSSFHVV
jgi:hypothetical protein